MKKLFFVGVILTIVGLILYFLFGPFKKILIIIFIGGIFVIPQAITDFKEEYKSKNKIDLYWFSKFLGMILGLFLLFLYFISLLFE